MLVLSRKSNQSLHIGNDIVVTIVRVRGDVVRIGIEAPKDVKIMRNELIEKLAGHAHGLPEINLQIAATEPEGSATVDGESQSSSQATGEDLASDCNADDGPMCSGPLAQFFKPQLRPLFANAT